MALARWTGAVPPAVLGLYCQLLSTLFVAVMALVAKVAGRRYGIPVFEIVLARSLVLLAMSSGMLARKGQHAEWPWRSQRRALLLLRGVLGFGAVSSLYAAVQLLPLSDTAALALLTPVLVAAAAPLVLGEPAGRGVVLALPLSAVGVLLVAQPQFLFGANAETLSALGVAIGLGQAIFSAAAKLCIRSLGSSEPVASIVFAMAGVSTLGSASFCMLLPHHWRTPPSAAAWALIGAAGLLGCGVQLLATTALKLSRAAAATAMSYATVVWGLLFDLLLFHQAPGWLSLLGAALVCCSSAAIMFSERRGGGGSGGGSSADASSGKHGPLELAESGAAHPSRAEQQDQERAPLVGSGAARG